MAKKFIVVGSLDINRDGGISVSVLEGKNEWDIQGNGTLRYVHFSTGDMKPNETVEEAAFRIYDNSTGCDIYKTFKLKEGYDG